MSNYIPTDDDVDWLDCLAVHEYATEEEMMRALQEFESNEPVDLALALND